MGCVITRDLNYEPLPNVPASVEGSVETPTTAIRIIERADIIAPDAGVQQEYEFSAVVRDVNVNQELTGLVFVDYDKDADNTAAIPEFPISRGAGDDPIRRRVTFKIPASKFATFGCHTVQLHVSERFVGFDGDPRPALAGDLGVGTWFVTVVDASNPQTLTGCDTYR